VTPQEKELASRIVNAGVKVANKFGPQMIIETQGNIPITTMASALMMANYCVKAGMPMFDAINLLVTAYKQAKEDAEERK
jgi:hypothetical protein